MKQPFALQGLDHVVIRVRDRERMLRFYTDVLGCRKEREVKEIGLVQLRAGRSLIDLVPASPGEAGGRNMDHLCLRIEPFDGDALKRHLEEQGIDAGEVKTRYGAEGNGPSIYFEDPEGNTIELKGPPDKI